MTLVSTAAAVPFRDSVRPAILICVRNVEPLYVYTSFLVLAPKHVQVHVTVHRFLFLFNIIATLELHQICWGQPLYTWSSCHKFHPQLIGSPFMEMRFHRANILVRNSIVCPSLSELFLVQPLSNQMYLSNVSGCPLSDWNFLS